ncbi:methyl-accepting chemotaxis protein [Nitrincola sp. MINF-07-Sa-05]|uniref:methyl-accepting chemotaxis protein n=1 Tax=Nitrincola salilacus TaxID=3400273 RepID=UPI003917E818
MKISTRIMLGATVLTGLAVLVSSGATGWFAVRDSSSAVETSIEQQFQAVATGLSNSVEYQFAGYRDLLQSLANGRMTQEAVYGFVRPFVSYRYEVTSPDLQTLRSTMLQWYQKVYQPLYTRRSHGLQAPVNEWVEQMSLEGLLIQQFYMHDNPFEPEQMALMDDRSDATIYGQQHRRYQASYRDLVERFGFNDLMLVDAASHDVIYSVSKSPVLGTSLKQGPFADSALARLVEELEGQSQEGSALSGFAVSDFAHTAFSFNQLVAYVGVPVTHHAHSPEKVVGYLIIELPAEHLTRIMTADKQWQSMGLGETGEAFLVDQQGVLITALRPMLSSPSTTLDQIEATYGHSAPEYVANSRSLTGWLKINTAPVQAALAGERGVGIEQDYLQRPMLTNWLPLSIGEKPYAMITQQSPDEAYGALTSLQRNIWMSVAVAAILLTLAAALGSWLFARVLGLPLERLAAQIMRAGQDQDLTLSFDESRRDEMGAIARALNQLFAVLRDLLQQVGEATAQTTRAASDNVRTSEDCRVAVNQQRQELSAVDASTEQVVSSLTDMAQTLTEAAQMVAMADTNASAGQQRVTHVAGLMQGLSALVASSGESMDELRGAAGNIGKVLDTIKSIAEQTNLLALNAAIEAARAGQHGRGFAVVADQVRVLAANTQTATDEIQGLISSLRQTVDKVEKGLDEESRSVLTCVEESAQAEQSLQAIRDSVAAIRELTEAVAARSRGESDRALEARTRLSEVVMGANMADQAMEQLFMTANQQEQLARELEQAAMRLRVA